MVPTDEPERHPRRIPRVTRTAGLRPRTPVGSSAVLSGSQRVGYGSEFGERNAIESDPGRNGDVKALQERRHQIYCTQRKLWKSHARGNRHLHVFRNETAVPGAMFGDFPGPAEVRARARRVLVRTMTPPVSERHAASRTAGSARKRSSMSPGISDSVSGRSRPERGSKYTCTLAFPDTIVAARAPRRQTCVG